MYKEYTINLDIKAEEIKDIGCIVRNDLNSNKFNIRLKDGQNPFDISESTTITFSVLKPNGTYYINKAEATDKLEGEISVILDDTAIDITGDYICTIEVYSGDKKLTSSRMHYHVRDDLTANADISQSSDYPLLLELMNSLSIAEQQRVDNENERIANEETRQANEATRQENETKRIESSSQAVENAELATNRANNAAKACEDIIAQKIPIATDTTLGAVKGGGDININDDGTMRVSGEVLTRPNLLINGGFDVWQRGESVTVTKSETYTADRWSCRYINCKVTKVQSGLQLTPNALRYTNLGDLSNYDVIHQPIENCEIYTGQTLTASFVIRGTPGKNVLFYIGNSRVLTVTLTEQWTEYKVTRSAVGWGTFFYRGVAFSTVNGGFNTNEFFEIAKVKLEIGEVATPYIPQSYNNVLSECQKFYIPNLQRYNFVYYRTNDLVYFNFTIPLMRTRPTINIITAKIGALRDEFAMKVSWNNYGFCALEGTKVNHGITLMTGAECNIELDAEIY